jgi:uncharacterized protein
MIKASFQNSSPFVKVLFSLFAIILGFTVFMAIGMILSSIFFGAGIETLNGTINPLDPRNAAVLKLSQACFSIGLFVFPPFMLALFFHGKIGEYLKLDRTVSVNGVVLSILLVFFSMPLINFLVMLNRQISFPESLRGLENLFKKMENDAQQITSTFLNAKSAGQYMVNMIVIALIPAIGEELLFRGIFQRLFHEWTKKIHLAIFISAFIFSAMHFQFYGFFARLTLGMLFGYLFYWSGNLWLPIIAHFINNSLAVTLYYIQGDIARKAENFGTGREMFPSVIFSMILLSVILYQIYKTGREKPLTKIQEEIKDHEN